MEYTVKFRRFDFFTEETDPYRPGGEAILVPRYAETGERVSTSSQPKDGGDPHVKYGLREEDEAKGKRLGAFFSDAEMRARDILGYGATPGSAAARPGQGIDPGASPHLEGAPLSFDEMEPFQIAAFMKEDDPPVETLIQIIASSSSPQLMGNKVLEAEHLLNPGEPREDVLDSLTAYLGRGAATGPEGSEGIAGTAHVGEDEDDPNASTVGEGPSEAAKRLIEEHQLDESEIQGTGSGGRITQQDVQKHLKENE